MQSIMMVICFLVFWSPNLFAQSLGDYLIISDIGRYKFFEGEPYRGKMIGGPQVSARDDDVEGSYTTYEAGYEGGEGYSAPGVEIQVHQNNQWLEHKAQKVIRETVEDESLGHRISSGYVRKFGANRIFCFRSGGGYYAWVHNNIWVKIDYKDLQLAKPEPLEVVEAYLQKWPPTYPTEATKLIAGTEQWIKDEMEYLITVSDRWFAQYDAGKETLKETMWEVKDKLDVFLRYRAKYFDEDLDEERIAVKNADEATLREKLKTYQQWLADNKDKSLSGL